MTIHEAVRNAEEMLRKAGIEEAAFDARELMMFVMGWSLTEYLLAASGSEGGGELGVSSEASYRMLVRKRSERVPLQYLTGKAYFYSYEFSVGRSVLIPRYDTEILVHTVLTENRDRPEETAVLDLGTGSGCIAAVLKIEGGYGRVDATDISREALETAKKNAENLGAEIRLFEGDLFSALALEKENRYDLIVSNPPYIAESERDFLEPEVRDYDPETALFGGADGLLFYRRIIKDAPDYLKPGGKLYFEIGSEQAAAVSALLSLRGFSEIRVYPDLSGKDRVVRGIYQNFGV